MALAEEISSRAAKFLVPISDAEPSGQNASFDPRYEGIRAEMASLDSPTGGEIDWDEVARTTGELLETASKDLLVASYWTYALLQTEGPVGLATGIATIDGLLENFWETFFPPARRLRGRGNALGWLVDRLEATLPGIELDPSDRRAVDLVDTLWKGLGAKSREKLEEHSPSFRGVEEALTRLKLKLPEAPPEQAQTPPPEQAAPDVAAPAPPSTEPPAPASATSEPPASPAEPAPPPPHEPAPDEAAAPAEAAQPSDPLEALRTEAEAWLAPISEGAPTGEDARYDEEYETCRNEVAQLEAPTGGDPDWKKVEALSGQLLKARAKDLLMASYLAFARYQEHGLKALPLGLVILEQILERYHEDVFPTRARGRGNAVGWLFGQLDPALGHEKLQASDRDTVTTLQTVVKTLAATVRARLEDHAPGTSPLTERLQRMMLALPKPQPKPEPKPEPKPQPAAPRPTPQPKTATKAPAMPDTTGDVGSAEEVGKFLLETGRSLVKAGGLLRRAELSSPAAYRLVRCGLWLHLHHAPPAAAGGKTQIPPLPAPRRTQFETIAANAKWPALIEETESALQQFRFCLDLNRMTDAALEALGDDYAAARAALQGEVATLVRRMPELLEYSAGDGSPLADDETKAWLTTLNPSDEGSGGADGDAADKAAMADVRGQIGSKPTEAVKLARLRIDEAPSPRSRFVRQLYLAEICLGAGQAKLARGMFAALQREMTERGLLTWEPDLASRCLEGLVRSIRAVNKAGGKHGGADEAFERLCLVDPAAAARLSD